MLAPTAARSSRVAKPLSAAKPPPYVDMTKSGRCASMASRGMSIISFFFTPPVGSAATASARPGSSDAPYDCAFATIRSPSPSASSEDTSATEPPLITTTRDGALV